MQTESKTVLVTGGSGFLGGWCVAELLRRGHQVRTTVVVRAMGLFDSGIRSVVGQLDEKVELSSEKAKAGLGWSPRPAEETIVDCAQSLLDRGVIETEA